MIETNEQGSRVARAIVAMLETFRDMNSEIELQSVMIFYMIANKPGIRMKELEKATGFASSTVSRNVLGLSSRGWKRKPDGTFPPGLDLVVTTSDPYNTRAKTVMLTPKGRRVFENTVSLFTGVR